MKRLYILLISFVTASAAMADEVSQEEALQAAQKFFALQLSTSQQSKGVQRDDVQATTTLSLADQGTGYYIFNRKGGGYVVIAADDKARCSVLGYSYSSTISASDIPESMRDLLDFYGQEITDTAITTSIKMSDMKLLAASTSRTDIEPLVKTQWGQNAPYNNTVVTLEGNASTTPTGCVATSTAQVMNYYQYPSSAIGTSTATLRGGTKYTLDLSNSIYDWDAISGIIDRTSYTDAQAEAVSKLMLDVGVALEMVYGTSSSLSYNYKVAKALIENFDYDKQLHIIYHEFYTNAEWEELIYNEIAEERPVIYSANTYTASGHSFICDGYANGYYHINWGWNGVSDGYFLLSALCPQEQGTGGSSSGYFYNASAVIGIQKPVSDNGDYTGVLCKKNEESLMYVSGTGKTGSYAFKGTFHNPYYASINIVPAVQVEDVDGTTTWQKNVDNTSMALELRDYYYTHGSFNFATLSDGTYTVRPAYYDNDKGEYYLIPISYATDYVAAQITISGDDLTSEAVTRGRDLICNSLTCDTQSSSYCSGTSYNFTANVTNNGSTYVYTTIKLKFYDTETNTQVQQSYSYGQATLEPGETMDVGIRIEMPAKGTYTLLLIDSDNNAFYSTTLTVSAESYTAENGITYQLENEEAIIKSNQSTSLSGDIVIPNAVIYDGASYTVTSIEEKAFYNCNSLTSIDLPNTITSMGNFCFYDCSDLASIDLSATSLMSLGEKCFYNCTKLTSVDFPTTLTSLGNECFQYCYSLSKVTCEWKDLDDVTTGDDVFTGIGSEATLYVPTGTKALYETTAPWSGFKYIVELGESSGIDDISLSGVTYSSDGGSLSISGLADGEHVQIYDLSGRLLSSGTVSAGSVSLSTTGADGVVVVNVGGKGMKVNL